MSVLQAGPLLPRWLTWLEERVADRRDATSCVAFVIGLWPVLGLLWCLQWAPLLDEGVAVHYRAAWTGPTQALLSGLLLWLLAMGGLAWRRRHDAQPMPWLVAATVMPCSVGLSLLCVGHGLKDNPTPMLLIYLVVVSRALFVPRALGFSWALCLALILAAEALQWRQAMPYAPLLSEPMFARADLKPWWAFWVRLMFTAAMLPMSGVLFLLAAALRQRRVELETLVRTDVLTGLANRREFMAQLAREAQRQSRSGRPLSLALFDIDHFKRVNDSWGHPVGDEVLARIGAMVQGQVRDQIDTAARYGGEEFVLLLPDTDLHGAEMVAQKLAVRLRAEAFEARGQRFQVTQSVGIAQVVDGDADGALRVADRNLYQAKQAGRDRIVGSVAFAEDVVLRSNPERQTPG